MKVPWKLILLGSLAFSVVVFVDWLSGREDHWKDQLASAVAVARAEDSLAFAGTVARLREDSIASVRAQAQADAAEVRATREEVRRLGLTRTLQMVRGELDGAKSLRDTAVVQARIIVRQDSVIQSDSVQRVALRATIAAQETQLGIKERTITGLTNDLTDARARLGVLIAKAKPPKSIGLFGFSLSVRPYVGIGANVSPAGKVTTGLQLGVSILRG